MVERIIPADLDGAELWRRNGAYVSADDYEKSEARVAELEAALRSIYAAGDAATGTEDWSDRVSAAMTDDIRALISDGGIDA